VTPPIDLVKAIRTGRLADVTAAFDAGAQVELHDGQGDPGLPLAIACFMGYADIVRELLSRGATLNFPDNRAPTSPLSMALRGRKNEVVKTLIELGVEIPPGTQTGLSDDELMQARLKAKHHEVNAAKLSLLPANLDDVEEINMMGCYGTDTAVLEADVLRAAREMGRSKT
jgi:ankyrin repeat protein